MKRVWPDHVARFAMLAALAALAVPVPAPAAEPSIEEMLRAVGASVSDAGSSPATTARRAATGSGLSLDGAALTGAARARLDSFFDEFDVLVSRRDYPAAKAGALRAAGDPGLAGARGYLDAAAGLAGALAERSAIVQRALKTQVGQTVRLHTRSGLRKGDVESVTDGGVALVTKIVINREVRGEKRFTVAWSDLAPEEEERLAKGWRPEGSTGPLARAALAISAGDVEAAERELAAAVGHPLVERYARKVDAVMLARAESDAGAALKMIGRLSARKGLSAEEARMLADLVASFREGHGETDLAKENRKALARAESIALRVIIAHGGVEGSVEFGGHRYKFYRWAAPWAEAARFCERLGGHLAAVTSKEENAFIVKMARSEKQRFWIGLSDAQSEGDFAWVTGEKSRYFAWAANEPNGGRAENDVTIDPVMQFGWRSTPKGQFNFFVCEWDPPRRGQPPVRSTSEDPAEVPPGGRKVVLYREDFEEGVGGWDGQATRDATTKSGVLALLQSPENKYIATRANRLVRDRGLRAGLHTRVSFRYRTEGALSFVSAQNFLTPPEAKGDNHHINLPPSTEWARADYPLAWTRPNAGEPLDLSRGFTIWHMAVYGGRRGEIGECFIDDYEIYNIVPGRKKPARAPKPKAKPKRG